MNIQLRIAEKSDAPKLLDIYAPYVRNTSITFEYEVPSQEEFSRRVENITKIFPWILCEIDGKTAGYIYASSFRSRAAFQWDAELSAYLSPDFHRMGIATALYGCLQAVIREQGYLNLYALITVPNPASIGFHESSEEKEAKDAKKDDVVKQKKEIYIHLSGRVKQPGVLKLSEGSRIFEAIKLAGGELKDADMNEINLAEVVSDGQKIYIPAIGEKNENTVNAKTSSDKSVVNINTASSTQFDNIPEIGPTTAKKIVEYRNNNGKFKKIDDLKNVPGIGEKKFQKIKKYITI
jgi:comEA protein